jgi:DNA-directed RNA polymerase specialized sigma24 family protein
MSKYKAIELLSVHHSDFIDAAKSLAGNNFKVRNYAEDYVQEAYIKLLRYDDLYDKIVDGEKASKGYMFFTLRSIIFNDLKKVREPKYNHVGDQYDMDYCFEIIDEGIDPSIEAIESLETKMYEVLKESSEDWFDYELFRKYLKTGKSFRVLAEESGLGIQTIYLSIKKSKLIIADKLYEDYVNYIKGNYNG